MNPLIIDNRKKIGTAVYNCFTELAKYHQAVISFNEERRRITSSPYIEEEKTRMINKAADALKNSVRGNYEEIIRNLELIRQPAYEMESLMDIGEDLQNALAVVKALGKAMPEESRFKLVEKFKGQKQALSLLKTAFISAEIASDPYFGALIFVSADVLDELEQQAYSITTKPAENTTLVVMVRFGNKLEKFALALGVELQKKFGEMVNTSEALNGQLRAIMGLGTSD